MASPYPFDQHGQISIDYGNQTFCNSGTPFVSELTQAKGRIDALEAERDSLQQNVMDAKARADHFRKLLSGANEEIAKVTTERNKLLVTVEKQVETITEQEQQLARVVTERDHLFGVVHDQAKKIVDLDQQVTNYQKGNETVLAEVKKIGQENFNLQFQVGALKRISASDKKLITDQAAMIKAGQDAARFARLLLEGFLVRAGTLSNSISGDLNHSLSLLTKVIGDN